MKPVQYPSSSLAYSCLVLYNRNFPCPSLPKLFAYWFCSLFSQLWKTSHGWWFCCLCVSALQFVWTICLLSLFASSVSPGYTSHLRRLSLDVCSFSGHCPIFNGASFLGWFCWTEPFLIAGVIALIILLIHYANFILKQWLDPWGWLLSSFFTSATRYRSEESTRFQYVYNNSVLISAVSVQ